MTPTGTRGIGQKSRRSEAIAMYRDAKLSIPRIAEMMDVEVAQVQEWVHGRKPTRAGGGRRPVSEASPEQRAKVKGKACIRCRRPGPCDPAHLIDRSLATIGADDPRAVVALCRECHRDYDEQDVSLLEVLEPHFREELAFAVERVGLLTALNRISGDRWVPVTTGAPE